MKIDPYNHKQKFINWFERVNKAGIENLNNANSKIILDFIKDFRIGLNVSSRSKKGERSFPRLNALRQKLVFIAVLLEKRNIKDITKVNEKQIMQLFSDMRQGTIKTQKGNPYKSTRDYVKVFKTFWHWYQKINKKNGKSIIDITEDLDTRAEKPKFVYFTEKDFENLLKEAKYDLKPIIALAFDSGCRATELANIKVSDFKNDFKELEIREETSKTFGRKINLMLCSKQIEDYIKKLNLKPNDYLCQMHNFMINKELRSIGKKLLSPEQIKFKNLTLNDFRHSSACFWLLKYKSESAMKYRFGWVKSDMIHYYTEFLGMKDTIRQEDLYTDITKTELEKQNQDLRRRIGLIEIKIKKLLGR